MLNNLETLGLFLMYRKIYLKIKSPSKGTYLFSNKLKFLHTSHDRPLMIIKHL